jgi:hypothetical protein
VCSSDIDCTVFVDAIHHPDMFLPIFDMLWTVLCPHWAALDNTQTINPEVVDSKRSGNVYCVSESLGELIFLNAIAKRVHRVGGQLHKMIRAFPPTMA